MSGPTYTYTEDVPQASTPFNQTQSPILNNFQAINELINVNHVGFNTANTFGKHNLLSLEVQSDDPDTASTDIAVYTKLTPSGPNAAEIFYRYPNNGDVMQLTGGTTTSATSTATSGGNASAGWCLFPSGVLMKWGTTTVSASNVLITLPTGSGIPTYQSYIGYVKATLTGSNSTNLTNLVVSNAYGTTQIGIFFNGATTSSTINVNYLCIGI